MNREVHVRLCVQ